MFYLQQFQDVDLHQRVADFQCSFQDGGRAEHHQHDRSEVLPLCQLLEDANQVDTGEEVSPTVA